MGEAGVLAWVGVTHVSLIFVIAFVAARFSWWRCRTADRQAKAAEQTLANERFRTATELFGHRSVAVRTGAVYALADLFERHPEAFQERVARMFEAHFKTPSERVIDVDGQTERIVDFGAHDTQAMTALVNFGGIQPPDRPFDLSPLGPYIMEGGLVHANEKHPDWEKWKNAVGPRYWENFRMDPP